MRKISSALQNKWENVAYLLCFRKNQFSEEVATKQ